MIKFFKNFRKDENGAVTVDWVVLTAAVVGLAVAAYSSIEQQTQDLAADVGATIEGQNVAAVTAATGTSGGD
jgi:Flp pilus assembly pilin Flp